MLLNKNTWQLILAGVLIALASGSTVAAWYQMHPCEKVIWKFPDNLVPAVYCAKDIPANSIITYDQVELRKVRESRLPANACDSVYVPIGRKLPFPRKRGEAICLEDFGLIQFFDSNGKPPASTKPVPH
jgi:hypothetical protein